MDGGEVTLELHGHYVDEASARAAARDYIEEWEFQADLTIGAGKLRLEFIRAEIVDHDPVFGDRHVPSWVTLASIRPSAIPAPVDYPNPPLELPLTLMTSCLPLCDSGTTCIRGIRKP